MDLERSIQAGTAVGIAILGVESFHKYLPTVADIRAAGPGDKKVAADVHAGELLAGIAIGTVSGLACAITGKGSPAVVGGVAFLAMFASYEWLLRAGQPFQNG